MSYDYDVSIIVSVLHPDPEYLRAVVLSAKRLAEKSHQKVELLLGNDGSPADEWHIFDECAALAPDLVKLFHFPLNRGIGRTRTNLIKKSSGRYVMPFDGDDILLPFDLDQEIAFLDQHPEYGASYAQKYLFNENGLTGDNHGAVLSDFESYFTPKININAMLIRREFVDHCHGFRQIPGSHINEDVYLMFRMLREARIYFSREGRCLYRIHDKSVCHVYGGMQDDFHFMAQAMVQYDIDLLRQWLARKVPVVPPERRRISDAIAGAALFLYQKNQDFAHWVLRTAIEEFPEDYGTWEHFLYFGFHKWSPTEAFDHLQRALRQFDGDVSRQFPLLNNIFVLQRRNIAIPPEIVELADRARREWFSIPEIVRANAPAPVRKARPSYSFVMPKIKF